MTGPVRAQWKELVRTESQRGDTTIVRYAFTAKTQSYYSWNEAVRDLAAKLLLAEQTDRLFNIIVIEPDAEL